MALIKCKECGKEISSEAVACPSCGKPRSAGETKKGSAKVGCLGVIGFITVAAIILSVIGNHSDKSSDPKTGAAPAEDPTLNAAARFDGERFYVTNNDDVDWKNCDVTVNLKIFGDDYSATLPPIAAHETVSIGAMQLAKGDGERFNPITHKAKDIGITCETPKGKLSYGGAFP